MRSRIWANAALISEPLLLNRGAESGGFGAPFIRPASASLVSRTHSWASLAPWRLGPMSTVKPCGSGSSATVAGLSSTSWEKNSLALMALMVVDTLARFWAILSPVFTTSAMSGLIRRPTPWLSMRGSPAAKLVPQPFFLRQQNQPLPSRLLRIAALPHMGQRLSVSRYLYFDSQALHEPRPSPIRKSPR